MELVADIGARMGFPPDDVAVLVAMVEHHLLLPDVATRRDLDDPEVIDRVAGQLGDRLRLDLLHALTEADSQATGPAAWGPWKAELVDTLVRRVAPRARRRRGRRGHRRLPDRGAASRSSAEGVRVVEGAGETLTVIDVDRPGLFSRVAGVLSLHGLAVLDANIATIDGRALEVLTVESQLRPDVLVGQGRRRPRARPRRPPGHQGPAGRPGRHLPASARRCCRAEPKVEFHLDDSTVATVVEVHAPDSIGVLYRITAAIAELDLDIVRAQVQTLLDEVVDSFYVQAPDGGKVDEADPPRAAPRHPPRASVGSDRPTEVASRSASPGSPVGGHVRASPAPSPRQDLLRWAEALAGIARTGLGFTESLYERERFEEILAIAADIRVARRHRLRPPTTASTSGSRASATACPATRRRRSPSAPWSATTRASSCWCSGPTPACGCTPPAGPTSATRRPRWR